MAISLYAFTANTKIESAKVNANFQAIRTAFQLGLKDIVSNADSATITFDMSAGNIHSVVLGDNRDLAVTGVYVGQSFLIRLAQDNAGSRTVTWWSGIKWPGGTAPTLSTTGNSVDVFMFTCTDTNTFDGYFVAFGLV
jgi:hypothetical protein